MGQTRYTFRSDDDGHRYLLTVEDAKDFDDLLATPLALYKNDDKFYQACDEFDERFATYRIEGGPESFTFTDPREES